MTIEIRRDSEIYEKKGEWFHARWHFSFDDYRDPENDSFGAMRVFNDDRLIPGAIWPLHPHRDVEGLTYVVDRFRGWPHGGHVTLARGERSRLAAHASLTL